MAATRSMNPKATTTWIDTMKVMVITLMTIMLMRDRQRIDILVYVIAGSIGYFAFKGGLFSIATGGGYTVWGPPDSRIEENNALGLATVMVLPLINYIRMHAKNKWVRRFLLFAMPVMFISALASQSRGAFLAIGMMSIFLWWKSKSKFAIGVGMIILVAGALSVMPPEYFERLETIQNYDEDQSAMSRINVWLLAYRFALDNPILGGGFDVLYLPSVWAQYSADPNAVIHNAHSVYFELMAMQGFVGLGLFLMTCIVTFFSGNWVINRCKGREDLNWARDLSAMCQVSLIGFATGGAFLNLAFFDLFWHIVAIPIIVREIVKKEIAKSPEELAAEAGGEYRAVSDAVPPVPEPVYGSSIAGREPQRRKSFLRSGGEKAEQKNAGDGRRTFRRT